MSLIARSLVSVALVTLFICPVTHAAPTKVQILSAVVKDQKIVGATVILQKHGAQSVSAVTDAAGETILNPAFGDGESGVLMIVKKDGYSNLISRCPCNGLSYAISPVMSRLDGMRIVLNWGPQPRDLDSHLLFPGGHIFFASRKSRDDPSDLHRMASAIRLLTGESPAVACQVSFASTRRVV